MLSISFWNSRSTRDRIATLTAILVFLLLGSAAAWPGVPENTAGPRAVPRHKPARVRVPPAEPASPPTDDQAAEQPAQAAATSPPAEPPLYRASDLPESNWQVSADEAEEFANRLYGIIFDGDEEEFILSARFSELVWNGLPVASPQTDPLLKNFPASALSKLTTTLRTTIDEGADYELQRIYLHDGRRYVRFRLINGRGGLNYHEFRLAHFAEGVFAEDVDVMFAGESQSQTLHRLAITLIEQRRLGPYRWLPWMRSSGASALLQLGEMARHQNTDPGRVIAIYDSLPQAAQQEKLAMLYRVAAAGQLNDEQLYLKALSEMRAQFPKDPSTLLTSIDTLALLKKYDQCAEAIDALDGFVGGDPYLDMKRAEVALKQGDRNRAESLALQVVESMPDVLPVHWEATGLFLEAENYEQTLELLKLIDERFTIEWSDLSTVEFYDGFTRSPQYEEWLKHRRIEDQKKARARGAESL